MYYQLTCPADGARLDAEDDMRLWATGWAFADGERRPQRRLPTEPVRCTAASAKRPFKTLYEVPVCLLAVEAADALQGLGIDNIQWFDAEIDCKRRESPRRYRAFNIVGTLDEASVDGSSPLIFRPTIGTYRILVHQRVRTALEALGLDDLEFIDPKHAPAI